ncbi:hypothetical protein Tco_0476137 [Tanacetum coccineum]
MVKPAIGNNVNIKIKTQFTRELRDDIFSRNKNDDAHEHMEKVLDIISLFNIPGVTHDAVKLHVFHITLTRAAKRWLVAEFMEELILTKNARSTKKLRELKKLSMDNLEDLFQIIVETGPRDPNETTILGRPFLATIHARINVLHGEISLGTGEDNILFDMSGNASPDYTYRKCLHG